MAPEVIAFVAVGSNLGNPTAQLVLARERLRHTPGICGVRSSPWYRSVAVGPGDQPDYLNAVFELRTTLAPPELLDALHGIEAQSGRVRAERWGARTLDLDLLLYANRTSQDPHLTLPHPRLAQRNFVVFPLHDLAPAMRLPDGAVLAELRATLGSTGLVRLEEAGCEHA